MIGPAILAASLAVLQGAPAQVTPRAQALMRQAPQSSCLAHPQSLSCGGDQVRAVVTPADLRDPPQWLRNMPGYAQALRVGNAMQASVDAPTQTATSASLEGCYVNIYRGPVRYFFREATDSRLICGWGVTWAEFFVRLEQWWTHGNHWVLASQSRAEFVHRNESKVAGAEYKCRNFWTRRLWSNLTIAEENIAGITVGIDNHRDRRSWCVM